MTAAIQNVIDARAILSAAVGNAPFAASGVALIPCKPAIRAAMQAIVSLEAIPLENGLHVFPAATA